MPCYFEIVTVGLEYYRTRLLYCPDQHPMEPPLCRTGVFTYICTVVDVKTGILKTLNPKHSETFINKRHGWVQCVNYFCVLY